MPARRIARPHRRHEPVPNVVREPDGVLLVLERRHRDDRPEDLVLGDLEIVRRRDDGRGIERAGAVRHGPTGDDLRALGGAPLHVAVHALAVGGGDQRAHLRLGIERIADLDRAREVAHPRDDVVVERFLDEEARARLAALPAA